MIIIKLSVRILQLKMDFFFPPNRKKVEKCSFSSLFQAGPLHQEETKLARQGEGSALVSAWASKQEQQQAAEAVLSPCLAHEVMNVCVTFGDCTVDNPACSSGCSSKHSEGHSQRLPDSRSLLHRKLPSSSICISHLAAPFVKLSYLIKMLTAFKDLYNV